MSIATAIDRLYTAKADIKISIEAKGVTVPSSASIDTYDDYVSMIEQGGGCDWIGIIPQSAYTSNQFDLKSAITDVEVPSSATSLVFGCFSNCSSLSSVTIPSGVTSFPDSCFNGCTSLSSVTIPSGETSIKNFCFYSCTSLTNIDIPSGVTSIGSYALNYCSNLTHIIIPSGLTTIGDYAFSNCTSLEYIIIQPTTPPTLGTSVFDNTNNCPIYVPQSAVETYKSAYNWSNYSSRIQAI